MIPGNLIFYPKLEINGSSEYYPLSASQLSHTKHLTIQAIESVDFTISFAASPQNYQCYFITPDQGTSNSFSGTINSNQLHQEFIFGCTEINNPVYNFVASIDEDSDDIGNQGIEVSIQFNGETPILRTIYADPGYVQESHVGDSTYTLTIISSPTGFNCSISGYGNLPPTQSRTAIFNTFTVVPIVCESI
jgi:hypothetical protein